jgi:hypothetical protein
LRSSIDVPFAEVWDRSNSLVEQILAASLWAESRVAILIAEDVKKGSPPRNSAEKVLSSMETEAQRQLIRMRLRELSGGTDGDLLIPSTRQEVERLRQMESVSESICSTIESDLTAILSEWISPPPPRARAPSQNMESAEELESNIYDEDGVDEGGKGLEIMPLHTIGGHLVDEGSIARSVHHAVDDEKDSQLSAYFYSSPLNIKRAVDRTILAEAKEKIVGEYNQRLNEVEKRKLRAIWQIHRLKALPEARQRLRTLRQSDMDKLQQERENKAAAVAAMAAAVAAEEEDLELSNDSALLYLDDDVSVDLSEVLPKSILPLESRNTREAVFQ